MEGFESVWQNLNQEFYKKNNLVHKYDEKEHKYKTNFTLTGFDRSPLMSLITSRCFLAIYPAPIIPSLKSDMIKVRFINIFRIFKPIDSINQTFIKINFGFPCSTC